MVQNLIQLQREQVIDLRDARIDHHLRIFGDGHRAVKHLGDKFLDQVLAAFPRCGLDAKSALFHNLIEKACFLGIESSARRPVHSQLLQPLEPPSVGPISPFSLSSFSVLPTASSSSSSSLSLPCSDPRKIGKPGSQIQQLLQRLYLLGHVRRLKIIHLAEFEVDFQLRRVRFVAQLVLDREREVRLHSLKNRVEVIGVYLDKLSILQLWEGVAQGCR